MRKVRVFQLFTSNHGERCNNGYGRHMAPCHQASFQPLRRRNANSGAHIDVQFEPTLATRCWATGIVAKRFSQKPYPCDESRLASARCRHRRGRSGDCGFGHAFLRSNRRNVEYAADLGELVWDVTPVRSPRSDLILCDGVPDSVSLSHCRSARGQVSNRMSKPPVTMNPPPRSSRSSGICLNKTNEIT